MNATISAYPNTVESPNPVRIIALSLALALNLTGLILVTRPLSSNMIQVIKKVTAPLTLTLPPPPVEMKPIPAPDPLPHHIADKTPIPKKAPVHSVITPSPPVITDEPSAVNVASTPHPPISVMANPVSSPSPVEATLEYISAPPPLYPPLARRFRMEGKVILRVLVDVDGKPLQVIVSSSSGHIELDKVAQKQVLAHWRFRPATQNGQPSQAWANIPIVFKLQN